MHDDLISETWLVNSVKNPLNILVQINYDEKESIKELVIEESTIIGRHSSCDIILEDKSVSRFHCKLLLKADELYVHDLDSRNGTYLNHQRVQEEMRVKSGDMISLGLSTITLQIAQKKGSNSGFETNCR